MTTSGNINGVIGVGGSQGLDAPQSTQPSDADIQMFEQEIAALLRALESQSGQSASSMPPQLAGGAPEPDASIQPTRATNGGAAAASTSPSTTSAGSGQNAIQITNTTGEPMTLGKFQNGQSTTDPSAQITLQPGQTGTIRYANGEAGFVAKADSTGTFQPNASRLEYEADADGKQKYPDVSYIDGRNASISLTDGAALHKGDDKSIANGAPSGTVTTDAAGDKTIAGYYDGSTATMQAGAAYMQSQLGTGGAYLHPDDDQLPTGSNPMSSTQSNIIYADFGNA